VSAKISPRSELSLRAIAQQSPEDWSFALREFVKTTGASGPIEAAESVASKVLERYSENFPLNSSAISVRHICQLLRIELRGSVPKVVKPRSLSSLGYANVSEKKSVAKLIISHRNPIIDVADAHPARSRIGIAHEIGHFLIHARGEELDVNTLRSNSSPEEELLSEYIGRLLLLPRGTFQAHFHSDAWSLACLNAASNAIVSIHAAAQRTADPDQIGRKPEGAIYWKLHPTASIDLPVERRLTPFWHLFPAAFIPIRRCHVKGGSVIGMVANAEGNSSAIAEEDVEIGSLKGRYVVDSFAWGSLRSGSRTVLSLFFAPTTGISSGLGKLKSQHLLG